MRVKDGERVVSKVFKMIDLFLHKNCVTTNDVMFFLKISRRSAQRYLKDAVENIDIKKNDDGSYSLPDKNNMYAIIKRNDTYLTTTLLQYAKTLFPENRYDTIDRFYKIFNIKNMASAIQVLESSSLDYSKIENVISELDYFLKYKVLKVSFLYLKDNTEKITTPYKIIVYNGFWYLIGVNDSDEIRSYRIDYISNITASGEKAVGISDKTKHIVERTTTIWFGNEEKIVEVLLDKEIKEYFVERPILKYMKIKSDDPFIIEVPVYNYMSLYMELMPYAPYFEILTLEAREFFKNKMELAVNRHI